MRRHLLSFELGKLLLVSNVDVSRSQGESFAWLASTANAHSGRDNNYHIGETVAVLPTTTS